MKTPFIRERRRRKNLDRKKKRKKKRKRGRERRSVARPTTTRESRGPVFVVVSFLFRLNLFLFFFVRRESRLIQTHLVSRARESSLVLRCARNTNTNTNTTGHTRAREHLSSLESRLESRRKVAGKCEKNKRERAATVRVFEKEETEIGRDEESTRKINTREAWKRTKNSSNSSKDTHRTAQTHARTETRTQRERGTDNTQREIE